MKNLLGTWFLAEHYEWVEAEKAHKWVQRRVW
jgi:hypothetical protein